MRYVLGVLLVMFTLVGCWRVKIAVSPSVTSTPNVPPVYLSPGIKITTTPTETLPRPTPTSSSSISLATPVPSVYSSSLEALWPLPEAGKVYQGDVEDEGLWRVWLRMFVRSMEWASATDEVILWVGERPPSFTGTLPTEAQIRGGYEIRSKPLDLIDKTGLFFLLTQAAQQDFQHVLQREGWRASEGVWVNDVGDQRITFLPNGLVHWFQVRTPFLRPLPPKAVQSILSRPVPFSVESDLVWNGVERGNLEGWVHRLQLVLEKDLASSLAVWVSWLEEEGWRLQKVRKSRLAQWQQWVHPDGDTTLLVFAGKALPESPVGLLHVRAGSGDFQEQLARLESDFGVPDVSLRGRTDLEALRAMATVLLMLSEGEQSLWLNPDWIEKHPWIPDSFQVFAVQGSAFSDPLDISRWRWILYFSVPSSRDQALATIRRRLEEEFGWMSWSGVEGGPPTGIWRWRAANEADFVVFCPVGAAMDEDLSLVMWEEDGKSWGWMVYTRWLDWLNTCEAPRPSGEYTAWPSWEVDQFEIPSKARVYAMDEVWGEYYVNASFFLQTNGWSFSEWLSTSPQARHVPVYHASETLDTWTFGQEMWTTVWFVPLEENFGYVETMLWPSDDLSE